MTHYLHDLTKCLEGLVREGLIPNNADGMAQILARLLETFKTAQCDVLSFYD